MLGFKDVDAEIKLQDELAKNNDDDESDDDDFENEEEE